MCELEIEKCETVPQNPDYCLEIANQAREMLGPAEAFVVAPPKGRDLIVFQERVQRALNDPRYDERFDAYLDASQTKVVVRRTR